MKIKTRIIGSYFILIFLLLLSLGIIASYIIYSNQYDKARDQLLSLSEIQKSRLEEVGEKYYERLQGVTSRTALRNNLYSYNQTSNKEYILTIRNIITDALNSIDDFESISIINEDNLIIASTNLALEGKRFSPALSENDNKYENKILIYNEENQTPRAYLIGPLVIDNKFLGSLIISSNISDLVKIVTNYTNLGKTGETVIASRNTEGDAIFLHERRFEQESESLIIDQSKSVIPIIKALNGIEVLSISNDYRNIPTISSTRYLKSLDLGLVVKIDRQEVFAPLYGFLIVYIIVGIFLLFISFILSNIISQSISSPLENLEKGIQIIQRGNLDYKVGTRRKDEIGTLSRAFDKMTEAIKLSQKEIDKKVKEQTKEIVTRAKQLRDQRKAILNILEDVDDEKNLSLKTAQDLKKFQLAVANASDQIVITDPDGIIIYANDALKEITGYEPADVIGQKAGARNNWGGQMDDKSYKKLWKTIKEDKNTYEGEFYNLRKDKSKYVANAKISPILDTNGNVIFFVGLERDITKAKEVDRMKTEFISLASHQLRTPLSAIKWFLEMLIDGDAGKLSGEQLQFVNNINESNERMITLVNSLLNISRIESGRIMIEPQPTNLKKLVNEVIQELSNKIKEKDHTVIVSVHDRLPTIKIDPKMIRHVYINLLSNAIKYTPDKGEIQIFISRKGNKVISQISDNGYGIPEKQQAKIFDKFFRGENILKVETDGTGLGLYLAKAIIQSSQGELWFTSTEDKGTTFWFSLPTEGIKPKKGEVSLDS